MDNEEREKNNITNGIDEGNTMKMTRKGSKIKNGNRKGTRGVL